MGIVEERDDLLKKYKREKLFSSMIKTLLVLCLVSFMSSYCIHVISVTLLKNNEQIFMILNVFYIVVMIMTSIVIFLESKESKIGACILVTILSGGLYDVSSILIKILVTAVIYMILIINFRKFRHKFSNRKLQWDDIDLGYFLILVISQIFITIFEFNNSISSIILRAICLCTFYNFLINFDKVVRSDKKECNNKTIIFNATKLLFCILCFLLFL